MMMKMIGVECYSSSETGWFGVRSATGTGQSLVGLLLAFQLSKLGSFGF
ncbi:hypothetical protein Hdeb2414_s0004g00126511 [Helianthus debilis subsp. tardiflorus]